jgi:hypothetical protein
MRTDPIFGPSRTNALKYSTRAFVFMISSRRRVCVNLLITAAGDKRLLETPGYSSTFLCSEQT